MPNGPAAALLGRECCTKPIAGSRSALDVASAHRDTRSQQFAARHRALDTMIGGRAVLEAVVARWTRRRD